MAHPDVDGPCLAAIRTREMIFSPDLAAESRWPQWRSRAIASGIGAVMSVPQDIDDQVVASLTLYARDPASFSPDLQLAAMFISEHACLLLAAVLDRRRLSDLATELADALADGETVNRAIGIVMAQRPCRADEALGVLRNAADALNAPLREIADRLVHTINRRASSEGQRPDVEISGVAAELVAYP